MPLPTTPSTSNPPSPKRRRVTSTTTPSYSASKTSHSTSTSKPSSASIKSSNRQTRYSSPDELAGAGPPAKPRDPGSSEYASIRRRSGRKSKSTSFENDEVGAQVSPAAAGRKARGGSGGSFAGISGGSGGMGMSVNRGTGEEDEDESPDELDHSVHTFYRGRKEKGRDQDKGKEGRARRMMSGDSRESEMKMEMEAEGAAGEVAAARTVEAGGVRKGQEVKSESKSPERRPRKSRSGDSGLARDAQQRERSKNREKEARQSPPRRSMSRKRSSSRSRSLRDTRKAARTQHRSRSSTRSSEIIARQRSRYSTEDRMTSSRHASDSEDDGEEEIATPNLDDIVLEDEEPQQEREPSPPKPPPFRPYVEHMTLKGHRRGVAAVKISPDGKWIASCSADATIRIWDATSGKCVHVLEAHLAGISTIAWSPDSETLASGSDDKSIRLWNGVTVSLVFAFIHVVLCCSRFEGQGEKDEKRDILIVVYRVKHIPVPFSAIITMSIRLPFRRKETCLLVGLTTKRSFSGTCEVLGSCDRCLHIQIRLAEWIS